MIRRSRIMANRVLVYFCDGQQSSRLAQFTESIVDTLGTGEEHEIPVFAELKSNRLLIGTKPFNKETKSVIIKRPSFCPIHLLTADTKSKLPPETLTRGIDVATAILLESTDKKILLQRRPAHSRTFPSVWVPPGGHVEINETLLDAGLRELREETGLDLTAAQCVDETISLLTLWESTFPPKLAAGLPKRHHAILYLYAKVRDTSEVLEKRLRPDPVEVGACAWIDTDILKGAVIGSDEEKVDTPQDHLKDLPTKFRASVVNADGTLESHDLDTSILFHRAPENEHDLERLSTGTKHALQERLKMFD